jgi:Skp family chaperone for outer membrane proteins
MNLLTLNLYKLTAVKKISIFLFLCLIGTSLNAQRSVRIGYIDTEYILENIDEYSETNAQLDSKVQQWKSEIETRLTELEDQKKQLNNERILLTNELISEREEDLQIIENEIIEYQQKRFGPNGDLMIQKRQLIQPIQDQIFAAVQEIAASKKYDFIFDKSADVVMLYSADRYDISEQVLRTINRSSKRKQVSSRKERKAADEEDTIVEVKDNSKDERQKLLDQRKADREALLEEKRQKKLEAREARRKEVEAKKQKTLEKRAKAKADKTSTDTKTKDKTPLATENEDSVVELKKTKPNEDTENEDPREARKKALEAKKQKALEKRAKAKATKATSKTTTTEDTKVDNDRETRKKALQEKKEQALKERKARLEAQKKRRDSIRNNK